jgi:hypothetical protein
MEVAGFEVTELAEFIERDVVDGSNMLPNHWPYPG